MKKIYLIILLLIFPFIVNANTASNFSNESIVSIDSFEKYKTLVDEEYAIYKDNLEMTYSKYVDILQMMRADLKWFYSIIGGISILLISGIGYLLKQVTLKKINTIVETSIMEELDNKKKDINDELVNFFENAKLGVKSKKIYYVKLGNESEELFLKQQGFNNIESTNTINLSDLDGKDLIIIDAKGLQLVNNSNEIIENQIKKIKQYNTELIVLLYIMGRYEGEKNDLFTFANNRITLVNQTIDCLNLNISSTNRTINNS